MINRFATIILFILIYFQANSENKSKYPYQNPVLSSQQRATDLLKRMSLEDKVYQLMAVFDRNQNDVYGSEKKDTANMFSIFGRGVQSVQPAFTDIKITVERRNAIQKYLIENTKWGIPTIFVDEGQHGLMKPQSTVFPMAIGLACSWDEALFEKVYSITANEMRSRGGHQALSPVIDVCRDPRWGRVEETYGEDPYLCGKLGIAAITGLQGGTNGIIAANHVAATLKHLCGHGEPQGGINQAPANISERMLREFHFPPFEMAVKYAKPLAVMPSYNEIDGIPSHVNKWLLTDVLRKEWGFKGMIVSDWNGLDQLTLKHKVSDNDKDAAAKAFNAGVQYELPKQNVYKHLIELVNERKVKLADVDNAVYQLLLMKFHLGLFDNPYIDISNAIKVSEDSNSRKVALEAAHKSIVLLKNANNLLPLKIGKYKKIAVVGPCANNVFMGGYSGEPYSKTTILDGIKNKLGSSTEVIFSQGCRIVDNIDISQKNWKAKEIKFTDKNENLHLINQAIEDTKLAEVIIVAVGETEHLCREAWSKDHIGDNMTLNLLGQQEDLIKAMVATGKPVILYLMNGRPLTINYAVNNVPAILEGWYMGQETGTAVADILFGDVNPSGKLTITFPKSVGHLPVYYNHKPSAMYHNYISEDVKPLFPFGYGLSYTTFEYKNLIVNPVKNKEIACVVVSVDVTNTGDRDGDEIAQLYVRDKVSSVTRPVKELKGFERISLKAGETKTVRFSLDSQAFEFWNEKMKRVAESGEFEIMVGSSSQKYLTAKYFLE